MMNQQQRYEDYQEPSLTPNANKILSLIPQGKERAVTVYWLQGNPRIKLQPYTIKVFLNFLYEKGCIRKEYSHKHNTFLYYRT